MAYDACLDLKAAPWNDPMVCSRNCRYIVRAQIPVFSPPPSSRRSLQAKTVQTASRRDHKGRNAFGCSRSRNYLHIAIYCSTYMTYYRITVNTAVHAQYLTSSLSPHPDLLDLAAGQSGCERTYLVAVGQSSHCVLTLFAPM